MSEPNIGTGEIEEIEHSTQLTECCEVEPEYGLVDKRCPECGLMDPRTIKRVTIERKVVRDTTHKTEQEVIDCPVCVYDGERDV